MFSLATLVKVMMSLAVFFTYALQFYVPVDLLNPFIQRRYYLCTNNFNIIIRIFFQDISSKLSESRICLEV